MFLKSHHWVDVPQTKYERRCVLRVRESKHTVMLFDQKYYDVETGKFKTDKLQTLNSYSMGDYIDESNHYDVNEYAGTRYSRDNHHYHRMSTNQPSFTRASPRVDDIDEQERKEVEQKIKEHEELLYQAQVKAAEERARALNQQYDKTIVCNVLRNKWNW